MTTESANSANLMGIAPGEVKKSEIAGHAIAGTGQNLIFGLWTSYMLVFFTDVFGIAGGVAGLIMLITRVQDALTDPIMGVIADRTRTRWGRYRPWLLFMSVPVALMLILNFSAPDFGPAGKIAYAAVVYMLMSVVYSLVDVPYWTLPAAMTSSVSKRTTIFSVSRTSTTLSSVIVGIIVIPLVTFFGGENMARGFFFTALVVGSAGATLYLIGFSLIREHISPPAPEKFSFKKLASVVITNRPLILIILAMIIAFSTFFLRNTMMIYYVQYNMGSIDLMPLFMFLTLPGMVIGMLLSTFAVKKLGGKSVFIYSCIAGGVINLIFFFAGYANQTLVMTFFVLANIPGGMVMVLVSSLIANTIEYAEWKTGSRNEGLISSFQTFSAKAVMAISGGLSGLMLAIVAYVPADVQPPEVLSMFHMTMSLFPAICMLLGVIPMLFYELTDKRHAEIVEELNKRREANK